MKIIFCFRKQNKISLENFSWLCNCLNGLKMASQTIFWSILWLCVWQSERKNNTFLWIYFHNSNEGSNYTFFNCYLAVQQPTLRQIHSSNVNHCILHFQPESHWEPRSEVGPVSLDEHMEFEPETFQFLLQRPNPLGHSPHFHSLSVLSMKKCQNKPK